MFSKNYYKGGGGGGGGGGWGLDNQKGLGAHVPPCAMFMTDA